MPGIPVTTADVHGVLLSHPALIAELDTVMVNYYPYWEGVRIDLAISYLHGWHQQIKKLAGTKKHHHLRNRLAKRRQQIGDAVASPENAAKYFLNLIR